MKTALIVAGVAVAAYLAYRWYSGQGLPGGGGSVFGSGTTASGKQVGHAYEGPPSTGTMPGFTLGS